ncbi:MAG TPA: GNAT family N-acetyltransferase [Actinomycetota bacterium]
MRVVRTDDAAAFLGLAGPLLHRDEARNNLILGIAATMVADPKAYEAHDGWVVLDPDPVAAAIRTPPRHLVLGDPAELDAMAVLADAVREDVPNLPGVTGTRPGVDAFVAAWTTATGQTARTLMRQGVYALEHVVDVPRAGGVPRLATRRDRDLVVGWMAAFAREATPEDEIIEEELVRFLEGRLESEDAGYRLWVVGEKPVSLAGYQAATGTGMRVGPVYTPPEQRQQGYATSLVAELSRHLLERGYRACYLYTDLDNPTPNEIYESIGYRQVAESRMVAFEAP